MEPHTVWNTLMTIAIGLIGWVAKTVYTAIHGLEIDLAQHKLHVAQNYVTNTDLSKIEAKLDSILEKLDRKADK